MPTLRSLHRFFHKSAPAMLTGLMAVLYRTAQELNWLPKDEVGFPFLILLTWILFLYWTFTGSRAVRWYGKAYKSWAVERRIVAYFLVISIGAVIGGATAGAWWKLFEIHRAQMSKLREPPPVKAPPPVPLPSTTPKQMPMPAQPPENAKHKTHANLLPQIAADVGEIKKNAVPTQRRLTDEQQKNWLLCCVQVEYLKPLFVTLTEMPKHSIMQIPSLMQLRVQDGHCGNQNF